MSAYRGRSTWSLDVTMFRFLRKLLIAVLGVIVLTMAGYALYAQWDKQRLSSFCAEARPGTPIGDLGKIAERHRVDTRWIIRGGTFDEATKTWRIFVPAPSTIGDMVCAIQHDRHSVISAKVLWL